MITTVPAGADTRILFPIGVVRNTGAAAWLEVREEYRDAMLGLEGFSHILVFFWFNQNDTPELRATLQVRPRKNPQNPVTGVFATHSPLRPNLVGLTRCRVLAIEDMVIRLDAIDARDGSPLIDIKCFIPDKEPVPDIRLPHWV